MINAECGQMISGDRDTFSRNICGLKPILFIVSDGHPRALSSYQYTLKQRRKEMSMKGFALQIYLVKSNLCCPL